MAHDQHTLRVSHYQGSANWRSAVAPQDRSWIQFVDDRGDAHLYRRVEVTPYDGGATVESYEHVGSTTARPSSPTL